MKNYKLKNDAEMVQYILEARDEYVRKKQRQKAVIRRYTPIVSSFYFAVLIGLSVWNNINSLPKIPTISDADTMKMTTADTEQETTLIESDTTEKSSITETVTAIVNTDKAPETTIENHSDTMPEETVAMNEPALSETIIIEPTESIGTEPETSKTTHQSVTETTIEETQYTPVPCESVAKPSISETIVEMSESATESPLSETSTDPPDEEMSTNSIPLPWDEMTINQQYNMAEIGSPVIWYQTAEKELSSEEIGEYLGMAYMDGYDFYTDTYYHCYAEAFMIIGISEKDSIAIRFENIDQYYLYIS